MECQLDIGYHKNLLYKNFTLNMPENGIVSFIGDNGSGKSTLYKTLLGIVPPLKGEVPAYFKQNTAIVSDYVHLPDEVNIKDILKLLGTKKVLFAKNSYNDLHNYVSNFLKQKIGNLSSGQRRIVEIYVVLAAGKKIIILDEASNALDFKNRKLFLTQVKKLSSQILFLHTSHELGDVAYLEGKIYGLFKDENKIKEYKGDYDIISIREFLNYEGIK